MLFPIDIHAIGSASRTAYIGDSGTDIGVPVRTHVVSVGNGAIEYAERGHTRWTTPPDTDWSVKIKLDKPFVRSGKMINYVFYTHLWDVVPRNKGDKVKQGDHIGRSGIGNNVPHLHVGFFEDIGGIRYLSSFDGQDMMWDEWLVEQLKPEPIIEDKGDEMDRVVFYQGDKKTDHYIEGVVPDEEYLIRMYLRAHQKRPNKANIADIYIYPGDKTLGRGEFFRTLESNRPERINLSEELKNRGITDRVGIRLSARPRLGIRRAFTAAIVYEKQ